MPQIAPCSTIYLLKGCPIDKGRNHTLYFATEQAQRTYFQSLDKVSFTNYQYHRWEDGSLRVQALADTLYECNYIMFNNYGAGLSYANKWFYGFINSVEYVDERTTKINYTIDALQTWLFDFELGMSFVEREHSLTDNIGDNLIEEDLELGEYQIVERQHFDSSNMKVAVLSTEIPQGATGVDRGVFNGIYSGLYIKRGFDLDGITVSLDWSTHADWFSDYNSSVWSENTISVSEHELVSTPVGASIIIHAERGAFIIDGKAYNIKITPTKNNTFMPLVFSNLPYRMKFIQRDDVYYGTVFPTDEPPIQVTMFNMPSIMIPTAAQLEQYINSFSDPTAIVAIYQYPAWLDGIEVIERIHYVDIPVELSGAYTPKNNKLFTHPFCFVTLSNNVGDNCEYRFEDSAYGDRITLSEKGTLYGYPTILCYPRSYRQTSHDYESGLILSNFPTCAWQSDVFKTWWNENKSSFVTSTVAGAVNSAVQLSSGVATGRPITAVKGTVNLLESVATPMAKIRDMKAIPAQAKGQIQADGLNCGIGRTGFTAYTVSPKAETLKIIDDFFTEFGYACHELKVPNIHARTKWTYTKTRGCVIHAASGSGLPADAEQEISQIFDNGITFWVNGSEVGNYLLPNEVLTEGSEQ